MQLTLRNVLKVLVVPFVVLLIYFTLLAAWKIFDLPPQEELIQILTEFIRNHGLIVIFIAAIIEGILLVGNYIPGGAVIFIGVIAAESIPAALMIGLVVSISFFVAYTINYFLGKYGWYKLFVKFGLRSILDSMEKKLSRHSFSAMISSYWQPNLAAVCSTAAGILHIPLHKFLTHSIIAIVAWNTFWALFVFITGDALLTLDFVYVLLVFILWCLLILGKVFVYDNKFSFIRDRE